MQQTTRIRLAGAATAIILSLGLSACGDSVPAVPAGEPSSTGSAPSSTPTPSTEGSVNPGPPPSMMSHMATQPTEGPTDR